MSSTTPPFTPDSELDLIFPPELISIEIKNQLPDDIHVRRVERREARLLTLANRFDRWRQRITIGDISQSLPCSRMLRTLARQPGRITSIQ
jgi:hypothetical protein